MPLICWAAAERLKLAVPPARTVTELLSIDTVNAGSPTAGTIDTEKVSLAVPIFFKVKVSVLLKAPAGFSPKLSDTGSATKVVASAAGRFRRPPPVCITLRFDPSPGELTGDAVLTSALLRS